MILETLPDSTFWETTSSVCAWALVRPPLYVEMFGRFNSSPYGKPCCASLLHYVPKRIGWRCCGGNHFLVPHHDQVFWLSIFLPSGIQGGNDERCDISKIFIRQDTLMRFSIGRCH
jgi:hypothetical protein